MMESPLLADDYSVVIFGKKKKKNHTNHRYDQRKCDLKAERHGFLTHKSERLNKTKK